MELKDSIFTSVLLETGYKIYNTSYRFNNNQLEYFDENAKDRKWIKYDLDNKQVIMDFFFKKKPDDSYPYSNLQIEKKISDYYKLIDAAYPLDSLPNYFEPVLINYFKKKNISSYIAMNEIKYLLTSSVTKHSILKQTMKIFRYNDSVVVHFPITYFKTNKYYGTTEKFYNINTQITFSKKLKISSLTSIKQ